MTLEEIMNLTLDDPEYYGEVTIKGYLRRLLRNLWLEKDGFSGKRPFGNSGWDWDIATCLVKNGAVEGSLDEDGWIRECNSKEVNEIILQIIDKLFL